MLCNLCTSTIIYVLMYVIISTLIYTVVLLPVACPDLTPPMNGMLDCSFGGDSDLNAGDTCSYLCDTGYMLNDTATRTCQSNSTWTGTDAVCSRGNI